jgi:hypothetical protein
VSERGRVKSQVATLSNHKHMQPQTYVNKQRKKLYCFFTASLLLLYCFFTASLLLISLPSSTAFKSMISSQFLFQGASNTQMLARSRAHTHTQPHPLSHARAHKHTHPPPTPTPTPTHTHPLTHALSLSLSLSHTQVKEAEQKLLRMEESALVKSVRVRWRESDKPSWSPAVSWLHQVSLSPPPPSPLSISWSSPAVSCLGRRLHQVCLCRSLSDSTRVCPHRVCADSRVCACHGMVMWAYRYVKYFKATCICQQV